MAGVRDKETQEVGVGGSTIGWRKETRFASTLGDLPLMRARHEENSEQSSV